MAVSFIGGRNWSTREKPATCRKSLTNFITYSCIKYASPGRVSNCQLCIQSLLKCTHNVSSSSTGSVLRSISEHSIMDIHVSRMLKSMMYLHIYIYTTSEKPVNDQSYGVLDRYGITILYKLNNYKRLKWFVKQHQVILRSV